MDHNHPEKLWTKDFILICVANLFMFTSFYFLLPTLPIFVTENLQGNESHVGYIIGILSLTAVLVRPFAGYLLDQIGRKKVLLLALLAFSFATIAYHFVTAIVALFILRALHGLTWGFTTTGTGTVAADVIPPKRRGEGLGYYGLSNTLAMAVGPLLGLYILDQAGFGFLFSSAFALALFAFFAMTALSYQDVHAKPSLEKSTNLEKPLTSTEDQAEKTEEATKTEKTASAKEARKSQRTISIDSFFERRVLSLSGIMFFTAFVYGGIVSFITLFGKEIGIVNAGTYFLIYAVALMVVRPIAGKIFDREGPQRIMTVGFVALLLSFLLLFMAQGMTLFVLSALFMGLGFGIVQPSILAIAINRVEPHRRGATNGTLFSAFDLGIGFGSIILGMLSEMVGLATMYLICGLITVLPLLLFYRNNGK
ncbi:MFS transporter [Heliorestis convoluta]|uniref:Major facilitator superfamily protein n=1 Tax=Heliorestis convoluta TaxID=356322 RepID=A0A5Q2N3Z2_9FIRM|nr:MFS transporter [Heliorestis convoluta]QGG49041.1 major facilitator superfamily protein [Heliorestis convoluta]